MNRNRLINILVEVAEVIIELKELSSKYDGVSLVFDGYEHIAIVYRYDPIWTYANDENIANLFYDIKRIIDHYYE